MTTHADVELMRIFDFTAGDLEANHAGRMSDRQIKRMTQRRKNGQRTVGVGCLVVIILAVLISQAKGYTPQDRLNDFWGLLIIGGLMVSFIYLG